MIAETRELPELFKRLSYDEISVVKWFNEVHDVVQGSKIDIIILNPAGNDLSNSIEKIKPLLQKRGIDAHQLAFAFPWKTNVLRFNPQDENSPLKYISLWEAWLDGLRAIIKDRIAADILPPNLEWKPIYDFRDIPEFVAKLRSFDVEPRDFQKGAKFEIQTRNSSTYVFIINEEGLMEITDDEVNRKKSKMIGAKFNDFNSDGGLMWSFWKSRTSTVISMKKL